MKIENCKLKIAVMLSGGVDSSVAAARLVNAGFDVIGVYMQNWTSDNITNLKVREMLKSCNSNEDEVYAKATADYLRIPFRVVNFEREYWAKVIEPFFEGIKNGSMPNPDIWCNQFIKYEIFLDWARANSADLVASGHYARLWRENSKSQTLSSKQTQNNKTQNSKQFNNIENLNLDIVSDLGFRISDLSSIHLLRGIDVNKDQSYFLSQVPKEKLQYALFPIGHLTKQQVRAEALMRGLPTATKPDSQGICFVGKVPIKEFLKERFEVKKGDVVLQDRTKVGEHDGAWFYTIGERIGIDQSQKSKVKSQNYNSKSKSIYGDSRKPLYIVEKDIKRNILVVGEDDGSEPLYKKEFSADSWNWFTPSGVEGFEKPKENEIYDIEIRYHQQPKSAGRISEIRNTKFEILNKFKIQNSKFKIQLREAVRAVTPGQTVVLSKGNQIIGAGIIQ